MQDITVKTERLWHSEPVEAALELLPLDRPKD